MKTTKEIKNELNKCLVLFTPVGSSVGTKVLDYQKVTDFIASELEREREECKQRMANSNEWWNKKLTEEKEKARINAFKEIVALRSGAVYDDYSSLYQHSAEIWIEYAKHESEFLNEQLDSLSTKETEGKGE